MPLHAQANSRDDSLSAATIGRNRRYGLGLFFVYLVAYAGFVLASAFAPEFMERPAVFGLNIAVVAGFGLIGGAFIIALLYGWLCRESHGDRGQHGEGAGR